MESRSVRPGLLCLLGGLLLAWVGFEAAAEAPRSCDAGSGRVYLLILPSPERVHAYAASLRQAHPVRRDAGTVIFRDGRVVTADVAAASRHLNELGWGSRSLEVVASFPLHARRRARG